jgi:sulfatase modifying factor 1
MVEAELKEKKCCCTPSAGRAPGEVSAEVRVQAEGSGRGMGEMVDLPGGEFLMGTDYADSFAADGERPVRRVSVQPFAIDRYPVTNMRFADFVADTGYRTEAEVFGWSFVFWSHIPEKLFSRLVRDTVAGAEWWCQVPGACWNAPEGPGSDVTKRQDHPAVHVSWNDAQAFSAWAALRLPTEAEWEYAARGGLQQKLYPWGDKLRPDGEHRCNIWQGEFPQMDTGDDGFTGTCPVDAFPPNGYGIYSVTGNTWEWCRDWFGVQREFDAITFDPAGPEMGTARVMKGGSFLCHKSYCNRYRVAARSSSTPDSSTSNCGFRCAR